MYNIERVDWDELNEIQRIVMRGDDNIEAIHRLNVLISKIDNVYELV